MISPAPPLVMFTKNKPLQFIYFTATLPEQFHIRGVRYAAFITGGVLHVALGLFHVRLPLFCQLDLPTSNIEVSGNISAPVAYYILISNHFIFFQPDTTKVLQAPICINALNEYSIA